MKKTMILMLALLMVALPLAYAQDGDEPKVVAFHTTEDGIFAVGYLPDGWTLQGGAEGLAVASDEALLVGDDPVPAGGLRLAILPLDEATLASLGSTPREQFQTLLDLAVSEPTDPADPIVFDEIQDAADYGDGALYVYGSSTTQDYDLLLYPMAPGWWGFLWMNAARDELSGDLGDEGWSVVNSVLFAVPLDATLEAEGYSFGYPSTWAINDEVAPTVYILGNTEEAITTAELSQQQVYILVGDVAATDIDVASLSLTEEATALAERIVDEGNTIDPPFILQIGDVQLGMAEMYDENDMNIGGVVVMELEGFKNAVYGVYYKAFSGRGIWLAYSAIHVLLSLNVTP